MDLHILIADDEKLDRELLAHLLGTCGFAEEQMLFASDGLQVVEIAKEKRPDLILLDIHMPVLSGIEALKQIRRFNQDVKVIIISAYSEFEYAKEALAEGAHAYLLKPIKPREFQELIYNTSKQLVQERQQVSRIAAIKAQFLQYLPILKQAFVNDLINGNLRELSDEELSERARALLFNHIPNTAVVAGLNVPKGVETMGREVHKQDIAAELKEIFEQENYPALVSVPTVDDKIAILLENRNPGRERRELGMLMERIGLHLLEKSGTRVYFGIGRTYSSFRQLTQSYNEATQALQQACIMNTCCVHIDDIEEPTISINYITLLPKLTALIYTGNLCEAKELLKEIWSVEKNSLENCKLQALEIVDTLLGAENQPEKKLELRLHYQQMILDSNSCWEIYNCLQQILEDRIEDFTQKRKWRNKSLIEKAQKFIEKHYAQQISLEDVAEHVNLSPAYFSSVFKQEMGQSFVEALNSIRIKRAKKLLADPTLNVSEVGYKVGFNSQGYFTRVFKKITKLTPSQWREENMRFQKML